MSLVRLSNPGLLLAGAVFYAIGGAAVDYLGLRLLPAPVIAGLVVVILVLLLGQYLEAYFDHPLDQERAEPESSRTSVLARPIALYAAILCGGLLAIGLTGLAVQRSVPLAGWLLLGLGLLSAFAYTVPPLRLATSGYGELLAAIALAGLVPAFGSAMLTGEAHRLVWLATIPLIALSFSTLITRRLRDYARDLQRGRQTLAVRLGWQLAMHLHDGAIVLAAALMAAGVAGGLPLRIGAGSAIVLPLAAAQIWQMRRIRNGFPPRWRVLTAVSIALPVLTAYFIVAGFILS